MLFAWSKKCFREAKSIRSPACRLFEASVIILPANPVFIVYFDQNYLAITQTNQF